MKTKLATALLAGLLAGMPAHAAMLAPGVPFPAWKLRDQTGAEVSSADLTGKTYLLWYYPKAMTPGCTAEGISLRDRYDDFRSLGVEILGVSFDPPDQNKRFAEEEKFPFPLLSDDGALAVAVGAAESSDQKTAKRVSYLVGPDGKVIRAYGTVNPADHATELLTDLRSAKGSGG
jgi:thioredoxin-dependent peroxiredoxin